MTLTGLILLQWFDSAICQATTVYDAEDATAQTLVVLETVGWLIAETNEPYGGHYTLAASKHGDTAWRGLQMIPKANVIASNRFEEPTGRKENAVFTQEVTE